MKVVLLPSSPAAAVRENGSLVDSFAACEG